MTAYNIVRFKVKPGQGQAFLDAHQSAMDMPGLLAADMVKTGENTFCLVAKWDKFESIAAARPQMISLLDTFRPMLDNLGNGLGVTDPVSGPVALNLK